MDRALLESVHEACLAQDLRGRGLEIEHQVAAPVAYGDIRLDIGFRLDLLVEGCVVVEVKSIDALASVHTARILTYLRFSKRRLGYLINFNATLLKHSPPCGALSSP